MPPALHVLVGDGAGYVRPSFPLPPFEEDQIRTLTRAFATGIVVATAGSAMLAVYGPSIALGALA